MNLNGYEVNQILVFNIGTYKISLKKEMLGTVMIIMILTFSACGSLANMGSVLAHNLSSNKDESSKKDSTYTNSSSVIKSESSDNDKKSNSTAIN